MEDRLNASQTRAIQYWFVDGLAELGAGVICLLLSVYFISLAVLPSSQGSFAITFLAVFVAAFGVRWLMTRLRQHYTYPRTGYVEARKGMQNRLLMGIAIAFSLLLLAFMLATISLGIHTVAWMPTIGGIIFAFIFFMAGYRVKLPRFYFVAGFCLLLGITLSLCGLGDLWGTAVLSLTTSLVLFAFGLVTRITYLRQVTVSKETEDEQ